MKVIFLEEASREFLAASAYYDLQELGLGLRFEEEIDRAINWIAKHPQACALRRGDYRRMNLHIFPYYIPYVIRGSTLWIVAIAQSQRRPEYWIKRTKRIG
jgi:toxin ParE1/3/4